MAVGAVAVKHLPSMLAAGVVLTLAAGSLLSVLAHAGGAGAPTQADWSALRFTLLQAALSTTISVALAVPVARALARRRFRGRGLLITALGAPFILPVIVAVLGLLAVFGRSGLLNRMAEGAGLPGFTIYGLQGVVLAHVFFNLPLAVRLILQGWLAIPGERFRLAASLDMSARDVTRFLERPMLREVLPGLGLAVFLICLTSFAVALILGGGPAATTLELAIYQAFRFDFDPGRAAMLAVLQATLCLAVTLLALLVTVPAAFGGGLDRVVERWDARSRAARSADAILLAAVAIFLLGPVCAILIRGVPHLGDLPASLWPATLRSVGVALASVAVMLVLALPLSLARARWSEGVAMLPLAASPLVVGTGAFLMVRGAVDPATIALPLTALVNAVMALPFAMRALAPAARAVERDFGRVADGLGMTGVARFRLVTLPRLRRPAGFAAGLTGALSMGDLGIVTLFAGPEQGTLPLVMFRLMGAYRMDAAYAAAVILLGLSLGMFWAFDRGGRADAAV